MSINKAENCSGNIKAWIVPASLILILSFSVILRLRLIDVPLERDEGEYAYAGQLILQGIPPYHEVYNMKLPGIYAAYALCMTMFGQSHQGIHTALLVINAITIVMVFLLARHVGTLLCAVTSAASFALLSVSQSVQGVFANAEHFVIVFAIAGLVVMLRGLASGSWFSLFAAGLILGLASMMKQHGLAFSAFAAMYIVFDSLRHRPIIWRVLAQRLLLFAGGVLSVFGGLCLIMAWAGVFSAFWFWTVDYASAYVSQVPIEQAWPGFTNNFMAIVHSAPLLWILIGFGFFSLVTKRIAKHHKIFLLMFAMFSIISICPGFYFRPHYFVLLLPCASIFAGVTISMFTETLSRFCSRKVQYGVPIFLIIICLCQSIYKQRDFMFHMTSFQISRSTYWLNPFPESLEIANFIRKHTSPEDRIAILGSEPQIFFYSQRRSASSYIYMYPLMEDHDFALQMQKDFIKDVVAMNPKYLIYVGIPTSWLQDQDSHKRIFEWFDGYLQIGHTRLVGVVELFEDEAVYHWEPDVNGPFHSKFMIHIFERTE